MMNIQEWINFIRNLHDFNGLNSCTNLIVHIYQNLLIMTLLYNIYRKQQYWQPFMQLFRSPSSKNAHRQLSTSLVLPSEPDSPKRNNPKSPIMKIGLDQQSSLNTNLQNNNSQNPSFQGSPKVSKTKNHPPKKIYNNQQALLPILQNSEKIVSKKPFIRQQLQHSRLKREERVYGLEGQQAPQQILGNMYENLNRNNRQLNRQLQQVVRGSINKNNLGIKVKNQARRKIPKRKQELKQLQQIDKYRMLKIKNGEIKNKIGNLRQKLEHQYYQEKAHRKNILPQHDNIKVSDYYSLQNPKTQQAKQFISKIREQRRQQHQQVIQKLQQQRQKHQQQQYQRKLLKEQQEEEKRHILQIQYAQKKLKKSLQNQQHQKKLSQIKQWSHKLNSQNQTPLYIRKQNEYIENNIIPNIYEKHRVLDQIKKQRMALNFDQIESHDRNYIEQKEQIDMERSIKMDMKKNQMYEDQEQQRKYYKGKYRYHALQDMYKNKLMSKHQQQEQQKQIQKIKRARQLLYSDQIRNKQKQKSRAFKTLQPKKLFKRRERSINGTIHDPNVSHRSDPRSDGKKNLHYLHNLVKQKGLKKDKPHIRLIEERGVYHDYMEEARQKRLSLNNSMLSKNKQKSSRISKQKYLYDDDQSSVEDIYTNEKSGVRRVKEKFATNLDQIEKLKAVSMSLDQRLSRNYRRKKNDQNIEFEDDKRMEDQDIQAVKAKLKLIRRVD